MCGETGGGGRSSAPPPPFSGEKKISLRKIGVEKREGKDRKSAKNDKRRRASSQKRDVFHTDSSIYFFL